MERTDDGWWRFHNQPHGLAPRFDFREKAWELEDYRDAWTFLHQPESIFKVLALMFRRWPGRIRAVRDLTVFDVQGSEMTESRIETREDYGAVVRELVGLEDEATIDALWTRVYTRVTERAAAKD